jgi:hypothetical protein
MTTQPARLAPMAPPQTTPNRPLPRSTPCPPDRQSRNAEVNFRGGKRFNATHVSTTDPDACLYKKSPGTGAVLCFIGHAPIENRSGMIVQVDLIQADGHAERRAAMDMIHRHPPGSTRQLTLGADSADFVRDLRWVCVTPHVAQKSRHSAIDGRTTWERGYALFPEAPQTNRRTLGLRKDRRWPRPDRLPRHRTGRRPLRPDDGRQQPRPAAGSVTEIGRLD